MDIALTEFKQRCLEIVRRVEQTRWAASWRPEPGECVLRDEDFEALR